MNMDMKTGKHCYEGESTQAVLGVLHDPIVFVESMCECADMQEEEESQNERMEEYQLDDSDRLCRQE